MTLPYISLPSLPLPFGQKIDVFGVLSTIGVVTGAYLAARAAVKYGPGDDKPLRDVVPWAVIIGLSGGHFLHIFGYHPELLNDYLLSVVTLAAFAVLGLAIYRQKQLSDNVRWVIFGAAAAAYAFFTQTAFPQRYADFMTIVKAWDGLSSMGGVLGALLGIVIFFRREKLKLYPYWDALALGTAPGWAIARIGCYLVHDHPGIRSDSPLAVAYPDGPRYDLGLADFFALTFITVILYAVAQKKRGEGLLMGILATLYSMSRFTLDFFRASDLSFVDRRYFGFTPAQFIVSVLFVLGIRMIIKSQSSTPQSLTAKA